MASNTHCGRSFFYRLLQVAPVSHFTLRKLGRGRKAMRKFKPTQINLLPKKKSFPIYVKKEVQWGNATERETDVWLTPKAEIMTHQSFQSGQNETAFVLSSPSGQEMLSELGNLSACPATVTTGSEVWGKTPENLCASVSSSVGDHQDPHLALGSFPEFPLFTT